MVTRTSFIVRHSEIDKMNIVYHANYLKWFEAAKIDYFNKAGLPISVIFSLGFLLPLSEVKCNYKSPAMYGDEIVVITEVTFMSCVKVKFVYKVLNEKSGILLAFGSTIHSWTDKNINPLNIEKAAPQIYIPLKRFAGIFSITGDREAVNTNLQ